MGKANVVLVDPTVTLAVPVVPYAAPLIANVSARYVAVEALWFTISTLLPELAGVAKGMARILRPAPMAVTVGHVMVGLAPNVPGTVVVLTPIDTLVVVLVTVAMYVPLVTPSILVTVILALSPNGK
jgi:hypothetical protein